MDTLTPTVFLLSLVLIGLVGHSYEIIKGKRRWELNWQTQIAIDLCFLLFCIYVLMCQCDGKC